MLPPNIPPDVPFSLTCEDCDAGMEIGSYAEAMDAGWTGICYVPELLTANFLGLCSGCRQREESEERARRSERCHLKSPDQGESS